MYPYSEEDVIVTDCPTCHGTGITKQGVCPHCKGKGFIVKNNLNVLDKVIDTARKILGDKYEQN